MQSDGVGHGPLSDDDGKSHVIGQADVVHHQGRSPIFTPRSGVWVQLGGHTAASDVHPHLDIVVMGTGLVYKPNSSHGVVRGCQVDTTNRPDFSLCFASH